MGASSKRHQGAGIAVSISVMSIFALWSGGAYAQGTISTSPPLHSFVDANGVDLISGDLIVSSPDVSIGQGMGALSYTRTFIGSGWTDNLTATIGVSGSTVTVSFGGASETFTQSGSTYAPAQGQGSILTYSGGVYTYTSADGTVVLFSTTYTGFPTYSVAKATLVKHPSGLYVTYTYGTVTVPSGCTSGCQTANRLQSVNNNMGYQLKLAYQTDTATTVADLVAWTTVASVTGFNNGYVYCDPNAACATSGHPTVSYTYLTGTPLEVTKTDALGLVTTFAYDPQRRLIGVQTAASTTSPRTISYLPSTTQVGSVFNGTATWYYGYSVSGPTNTTTVTDPLGNSRKVASDTTSSLVSSDTDANNHTTSYLYNSVGLLTQVTKPEGDEILYAYDARGNVTTTTFVGKPGSGVANQFLRASFDTNCDYVAKCNKPNSTQDAAGKETDYTYNTTRGVLTSITRPADSNGVQPQAQFVHNPLNAWYKVSAGTTMTAATPPIYMLTFTSSCQTNAPGSCSGTLDQIQQSIAYVTGNSTTPSNLATASITTGDGAPNTNPQHVQSTIGTTFDVNGNLLTARGPLGPAQTTQYFYDADREVIGVVAPNPGESGLNYPATRYTYDGDGQLTKAEIGTVVSQSQVDWVNFISQRVRSMIYDGVRRKVSDLFMDGSIRTSRIEYSYDDANNLQCTAVRMNSAYFAGGSAGACVLNPPGTSAPDNMPDQITFAVYDAVNRPIRVTQGYGTSAQADIVTTTYTPNGQVAAVTDAQNNTTAYSYDGHDRLSQTCFPAVAQGSGTCDSSNYESYTYNITNTLNQQRLRDGTLVNYFYDDLNRLTLKGFPATTSLNVYYSYDLLDRPLYAHSPHPASAGVEYAYDALGRASSEARSGQTMGYQYDAAGNRTRITWPDATPNTLYVTYAYDMLNRVMRIGENGATSGIGLLASYTYDDHGRRTNIDRAGGAGASTLIGYDGSDRINLLKQNFAATANDVAWTPTYSYNLTPQLAGVSSTNDAYAFHAGAVSRNYVTNGLNQYASVAGNTWNYDGRGNLTSNTSASYTYDPQNRLLTASGPTPVTLTYDPVGHLQTSATASATTTFLYAGGMLVGEYDASGNILRRYVPGPGIDEPLVWYEGTGTGGRRWLHTDIAGSVVGYSDGSANSGATYAYDPYGLPNTWAIGASRFRYTGQIVIPEAHLYYYKARFYDPTSGRFLQGDPIGYQSDMNLYAYTNNDPINGWDPSGMDGSGDSGGYDPFLYDDEDSTNVQEVVVPMRPPEPPPPDQPNPDDQPNQVGADLSLISTAGAVKSAYYFSSRAATSVTGIIVTAKQRSLYRDEIQLFSSYGVPGEVLRQVELYLGIPWYVKFFTGPTRGFTPDAKHIYLDNLASALSSVEQAGLIGHELFHAWEYYAGTLTQTWYLGSEIKNGGYWRDPYEQRARVFERGVISGYCQRVSC